MLFLSEPQRLVFEGKRCFTLIELLIVIMIIAILSALLMPALQKSIGIARTMNCTSNMRQVNIGLIGYSDDNNGIGVKGLTDDSTGPHQYWRWPSWLMPYVYGQEKLSGSVWQYYHVVKTGAVYETASLFACPEQEGQSSTINSVQYQASKHIGINYYMANEEPFWFCTRRYRRVVSPTLRFLLADINVADSSINTGASGQIFSKSDLGAMLTDWRVRHNTGSSANFTFLDGHAATMNGIEIPDKPGGNLGTGGTPASSWKPEMYMWRTQNGRVP